jgi:hypothetical protein
VHVGARPAPLRCRTARRKTSAHTRQIARRRACHDRRSRDRTDMFAVAAVQRRSAHTVNVGTQARRFAAGARSTRRTARRLARGRARMARALCTANDDDSRRTTRARL